MRLETLNCHFHLSGNWSFYLGNQWQLPLFYLSLNSVPYRLELELFGVIILEVCPTPPDNYVSWDKDREAVMRERWARFQSLPFVRWTFHFDRRNYWHAHTHDRD